MSTAYSVTEGRLFSKIERQMIWHKPESHQTSQEEIRIASEIKENWADSEMKIFNVLLEGDAGSGKTQLVKALSADLQLPYTKITCFADMDKSDVFGALLPIVSTDQEEDAELLEAIYQTESLQEVLILIQRHYSIPLEKARQRFAALIQQIEANEKQEVVHYKFYPSEIVRALEKGYLLEIQEPTVIRDASVLVALNSALEANGMLNLPIGIVQRHPDCVVVITTNRNYQGNRPLNESLRDRMQHAEKMDLPEIAVMVKRGKAKTGFENEEIAGKMAEIIRLLDNTAKANAIKGVAGMRSYFYWLNSVKQGQNPLDAIFVKVLYKLTTDEDELAILEAALEQSGLLTDLRQLFLNKPLEAFKKQEIQGRKISQEEADQRNIMEEAPSLLKNAETHAEEPEVQEEASPQTEPPLSFEQSNEKSEEPVASQSGTEATKETLSDKPASIAEFMENDKQLKKQINKEAREVLKQSLHAKEGLIVHRPAFKEDDGKKARQLLQPILPMIQALVKEMQKLLENEEASAYGKGKYSGTRFDASKVVYGDYKTFDKKNPPNEKPSLAVALRVDESGSMLRDDRIKAAQLAALAVNEFAKQLNIPLMIYGDTADLSVREKTSFYSYKEFSDSFHYVNEKLMTLKPRQNNRDGAVLRVLAEKLLQQSAQTKLLINISDGQPKALPDYTGAKAAKDIQDVLRDYERQNIVFLAAAIGQDKEIIKDIYGESRFIDISNLQEFPRQLITLISRYL